jgi:hypothetical protein
MPKYQITGKNGGMYELEAADDNAAMELESYINQRIDAGDPDITQPPPNTQVLPWEAQPDSPGSREPGIVTNLGQFGEGVSQGFGKVIDNAARAGEWAVDKIGLGDAYRGLSTSLGMAGSVNEAVANRTPARYEASGAGKMIGEMIALLPTAPLGVLGGGAVGGALSTDERDASGIATDAGIGAAASLVGDRLIRGVAGVARPAINDTLQTLVNSGIRVTPGQVGRSGGTALGSVLGAVEDKAMSLPVAGDLIASRRRRGFDQFGRATVNRALEPIGETLPAGETGRRAVAFAGDRLSAAYDEVLPRLSATGDQQFVDDLAGIHGEASMMEPGRQRQFENILNGLGRYWQNGVSLDGAALKDIETRIGERVRRAAMSTDADQRELGDRLGDVLASVRDLAARQNPAEAETLSRINQGWKSLTQVERAAGNSGANITPAGYSQAVKASSDTVRRRGYARGNALNQDLSDAASAVLPSQTPDSGTAGRIWQSNILGLGIGSAAAIPQAGAQAVTDLYTRRSGIAPDYVKQLLLQGAQLSPAIAPPSVNALLDQ